MPLRLLAFVAVLLLAAPGCDLISSDLIDGVPSGERTELERLTSDFFECDADVRSVTDSATGTLESGDCLQSDDSYQDFYAFRLTEPARVDLDLVSSDFAPYLILLIANLNTSDRLTEVARDRNEGRMDRVNLSVPLPAGLYLVYANSVSPDEEGDYTLTVDAATEDGSDRPARPAHAASGAK